MPETRQQYIEDLHRLEELALGGLDMVSETLSLSLIHI